MVWNKWVVHLGILMETCTFSANVSFHIVAMSLVLDRWAGLPVWHWACRAPLMRRAQSQAVDYVECAACARLCFSSLWCDNEKPLAPPFKITIWAPFECAKKKYIYSASKNLCFNVAFINLHIAIIDFSWYFILTSEHWQFNIQTFWNKVLLATWRLAFHKFFKCSVDDFYHKS